MIAAPNTKVYRQKLHLLVELVNRRRYFRQRLVDLLLVDLHRHVVTP